MAHSPLAQSPYPSNYVDNRFGQSGSDSVTKLANATGGAVNHGDPYPQESAPQEQTILESGFQSNPSYPNDGTFGGQVGSCLCGSIWFALKRPVRTITMEHSDYHRRCVGNAAPLLTVQRDNLIVWGEENIKWYQPTDQYSIGFCETCGSKMFDCRSAETWKIFAGIVNPPTALMISKGSENSEKKWKFRKPKMLLCAANPNAYMELNPNGHCSCQSVKYQMTHPPLKASIEHSLQTRKFSGHWLPQVQCNSGAVTIWGADNVRWYTEPNSTKSRGFCASCGSSLFEKKDDVYTYISMGTFECNYDIPIMEQNSTDEAGDYYTVRRKLSQFGPLPKK